MGPDERTISQRGALSSGVRWCLRWLSATETSVALIVALVFVLAWATVFEGVQGRAAVEYFVYRNWWFIAVFFLMGVNVLAALVARLPWHWHQCGFLMTHVGLLGLLAAMAQSSHGTVEGRMALQKADRAGEVELMHRSDLRIQQVDGNPPHEATFGFHDVPLELTPDAFDADSRGESISLRIVEFESGVSTDGVATRAPELSRGSAGSSALIELKRRGDVQQVWLPRNGEPRTVTIDHVPLQLELSSQCLVLDFSVELVESRQMRYAGGDREAAFVSRIRFRDTQLGTTSEAEIAVNQPATFGGFKFFHLDVRQLADGDSEVILGVTRDRGRVSRYLSTTMICLGMIFTLILSLRTPSKTGA